MALALMPAVASVAKQSSASEADDAAIRKARYYYLEGARLQSEDKPAEAYEMFRHALRVRPDYPEAAMQVAQIRVVLRHDSLRSRAEGKRSLRMMQDYVDSYPGDFFENQYYGYIATQLDTLAEARRIYERADSLYPEKTMSLLKLAEVCLMMRDKTGAFDALDRYQAREGRSDYLTQVKVLYQLSFADTVAALREATLNVSENPKSASARMLRAKVLELMNEADSARSAYAEAERLDPDDGAVKFELARFLLTRGDSAGYEQKIYEGLMGDDLPLEQKLGMLTDFVRSMNLQSADTVRVDRLFDVMAGQYPHEAPLRQLAAGYNFQRGNVSQALEDIDYAIDLDPTNEEYYAQKLMMEAYEDRYPKALETFRRAEKAVEPSWRLLEIAGQCAAQVPDEAEAMRIYDRMLEMTESGLHASDTVVSPQTVRRFDSQAAEAVSRIYCSLGDMLHKLGRKEQAYRKYQVALDVFPLNPLALNNYAYFSAVDGGDLEKALEMSGNALEIEPGSVTYLDTFAYILLKLGRPEEALEYQLQAIDGLDEEDESSAELFEHLGDIYSALGKKSEATDNWKKAYKLDPASTELKTKLGNAK